jgi:hypothetical protein
MITELTINKSVLSTFGKAVKGAVALNFGLSGGANCDTECSYHPSSTSKYASEQDARCYAHTCENRGDRVQLKNKLQRHEDHEPDAILDRAILEYKLNRESIPWFRFSSFGSVPTKVPGKFVELCKTIKCPIHLPVESHAKYLAYTKAVGNLCTVRTSVPVQEFMQYPHACSTVVGCMTMKPRERTALGLRIAKERKAVTGRTTKVCPAIASAQLRTGSKRAKCGACTLCADSNIDIVYPVHA